MLTWQVWEGCHANDVEEIHKAGELFCFPSGLFVVFFLSLLLSGLSPPPESSCYLHHILVIWLHGISLRACLGSCIESLGLILEADCSGLTSWAFNLTAVTIQV